mmetsp:Transcript_22186/g.32396  ORF Transcript_22186/g.32396 Transcript_22186/m.32396 type:complete len:134 (+) Transcript_22186:90-491(+)
MNGSEDLHYPNLEHCAIIAGSTSSSKNAPPTVTIAMEILEAMDAPLPEIYNFELEKNILRKQEDGVQDGEAALKAVLDRTTRDVTAEFTAFQKDAFKRMKSITNAPEDVCSSILHKRGFKLNDSIEAFYRGER